jgi:adenine-specific DNA-methyltransferase
MATGISHTKWNGNPQKSAPECPITLHYEGKIPESIVMQAVPGQYTTIYAQNNQNLLFYGDNLSVLGYLAQDADIRGKVRLIYIDPPYATGMIFQSRSQSDAYQDMLTGANYLEFLRRRLILLRELLADDGSIYVHLDENMAFYVKIIMDEVFGPDSFRNWITRRKSNPKNYTRKRFGNVSDYIMFYSKSDSYVWNRAYEAWTPDGIEREYPYFEQESGRRYKKVPIHAPGTRNGETGQPWRGMNPPPGKHWQYTPTTLEQMDQRGEIYWSPNGNPRRKVFLDESEGKPAQDIWLDFRDAHNQNFEITGYPTEKNPDLLARIIQASSNPGDIVLDCFAGSGVTLAVSHLLGRRWIGVDNSKQAIEAILRRFVIGTERMGDFVQARNTEHKPNMQSASPSLFDLLEDETIANKSPVHASAVRDFSLYAEKGLESDIEDLSLKWLITHH